LSCKAEDLLARIHNKEEIPHDRVRTRRRYLMRELNNMEIPHERVPTERRYLMRE
jgi:hypothetical protein